MLTNPSFDCNNLINFIICAFIFVTFIFDENLILKIIQIIMDPYEITFLLFTMPFKSDEKFGKIGRTFPDFDFRR